MISVSVGWQRLPLRRRSDPPLRVVRGGMVSQSARALWECGESARRAEERSGWRCVPCGRFFANAAWWRLIYLCYNVIVVMKRKTLPLFLASADEGVTVLSDWLARKVDPMRVRLFLSSQKDIVALFPYLTFCGLHRSARMGFSPAGAHGFHRVAFADLDAGLAQTLPDFFMLAPGRQIGFL